MVLRDNPFSCHIDIVFRIFVSENTQVLGKLYAQEASVVWNGNNVKGVEDFFNNLPTSEHTINSLDCQPVSGKVDYAMVVPAKTLAI